MRPFHCPSIGVDGGIQHQGGSIIRGVGVLSVQGVCPVAPPTPGDILCRRPSTIHPVDRSIRPRRRISAALASAFQRVPSPSRKRESSLRGPRVHEAWLAAASKPGVRGGCPLLPDHPHFSGLHRSSAFRRVPSSMSIPSIARHPPVRPRHRLPGGFIRGVR